MSVWALHLPCILLLAALLWVTSASPAPLQCSPRHLPGLVIEVGVAVAKGARFTDPINAASAEECVSACCSETDHAGGPACNLAVYDARKSTRLQNCYLFLCPRPEACPMSPARGVQSYSLWTENSGLEHVDAAEEPLPKTAKSKVLSSSSKEPSSGIHPVVPAAAVSEEEVGQQGLGKNRPAANINRQSKTDDSDDDAEDTPAHIASKLLHLAENIDKRLEKIEAKPEEEETIGKSLEDPPVLPADAEVLVTSSKHEEPKKPLHKELEEDPKKTRVSKIIEENPETLEVHFPTPKHTTTTTTMASTTTTTKTTTKTSVGTSHKITTAALHPVQHTSPNVISSSSKTKAAKVPNLNVNGAMGSSSHFIKGSVTTAKSIVAGHSTTTTEIPTTSTTHQAKFPPPKTPDHPSRTSKVAKATLKAEAHSYTSGDLKELDSPVASSETPSSKSLDALEPLLDKSGLVAALVFGVLFVAVVIGLLSRKVTEARRRHQYTKLDYLINGMYVDT